MDPSTDEQRVIEIERLVLQALCQGTREGPVLEEGKLVLKDYPWRETTHRVVYEVLITLPTDAPEVISDQLPSRLTRRGFPDIPWEDLFKPHSLSRQEAKRLMRRLSDLS